MTLIKQGSAYTRLVLMVATSDHITGKTAAAPVVTLSKAGAAFASAAGSVAELANGFYTLRLTQADTNTFGDLAVHVTGSGADPTDFVDQVVGFDPTVDIASLLPYGSGPIQWTYTLTRSDTGVAVAGATVYVTSDIAGVTTLAGPTLTDASGQVTFFLPAGTVYVWRFASGFSAVNPEAKVVA